MYTVLLVDDEEKILEVMKVRIGWQELGVDKLLTCLLYTSPSPRDS